MRVSFVNILDIKREHCHSFYLLDPVGCILVETPSLNGPLWCLVENFTILASNEFYPRAERSAILMIEDVKLRVKISCFMMRSATRQVPSW